MDGHNQVKLDAITVRNVVALAGEGQSTDDLLAVARRLLGQTEDDIPAIARLPGIAASLDEAANLLADAILADGFRKDAAAVLLAGEMRVTADMQKLQERLALRRIEVNDHPKAILRRVLEQKSSTKGCSNCNAVIPVKFVLTREPAQQENENKTVIEHFVLKCPICGDEDFAITEGDKNRLAKLHEDVQDLEQRLADAERKAREKSGGVWIVGARSADVPPAIAGLVGTVRSVDVETAGACP